MDREQVLDLVADFTWDFGRCFFLETSVGNFIWSDPNYGGDNTLTLTRLSFSEWIDPEDKGLFGRHKDKHVIRHYCGDDVIIVKE